MASKVCCCTPYTNFGNLPT